MLYGLIKFCLNPNKIAVNVAKIEVILFKTKQYHGPVIKHFKSGGGKH